MAKATPRQDLHIPMLHEVRAREAQEYRRAHRNTQEKVMKDLAKEKRRWN
jgi:hypothetical protein